MIERLETKIIANPNRVLLQFFNLGENRSRKLIDNILKMNDVEVNNFLCKVVKQFENRHLGFEKKLIENYHRVKSLLSLNIELSNEQKLLIGAYFSKEYSIEAAALFNPSIVPHPDQNSVKSNELKFILSLRATGEGHISSIEFREGSIDEHCNVNLIDPSKFVISGEYTLKNNNYEKYHPNLTKNEKDDCDLNNYSCSFNNDSLIDQRVLFPHSYSESMGLEDLRLVKCNFDGKEKYYGTYTAYNGRSFRTQLIETYDFIKFDINVMTGKGVIDKGLSLFPRKINNKYIMTSRQDGVNLFIMTSDNLYEWSNPEPLKSPTQNWELVQIGNCGSPIETERGWLLLTHGVGPLRKYVISAILLDLDDPSKVIGELHEPLIEPNETEREGYVPNVVYSCGSLIHNGYLILPYAMSDSASGFAKIKIDELINKM